MPQYLLTIYQPDAGRPDEAAMARIEQELHRLNEDLRQGGSWVFSGGLHPPDSATVVRRDGSVTDGPYLESKEHIGGFWVINAPDRDAALDWARRAAGATTLPIEVRSFQDREPF